MRLRPADERSRAFWLGVAAGDRYDRQPYAIFPAGRVGVAKFQLWSLLAHSWAKLEGQ